MGAAGAGAAEGQAQRRPEDPGPGAGGRRLALRQAPFRTPAPAQWTYDWRWAFWFLSFPVPGLQVPYWTPVARPLTFASASMSLSRPCAMAALLQASR